MQISLAIHSSPRFSTWLWFNDWKLLIDAGDGASQQLGYKIRKIDTFLMTHSHRDHIGGLLQAINQRGEAGPFTLGHPTNGRSWGQIESFSLKFNPGGSRSAVWRALEEGDWMDCGVEGRWVQSFRTRHYLNDEPQNAPRSLGYNLVWRKRKLRPELQDLPKNQVAEMGRTGGSESITVPVDEKWVCVSGDTQPISPETARGAKLLIHEATFLDPEDYDSEEAGEDVGHMHSTVFDAIRVAKEADVENLVLYHISTRYADAQIREAIGQNAQKLGFKGQIWAALPRRIYWDLLREKPVFASS